MTKERVILAFVAIIAGLVVASSLFYFYQQKKPQTQIVQTPSPTVSTQNGKPTLAIDNPQDEMVTSERSIDIKGTSIADALIVIATNTEDFIVAADEEGQFSQRITLSDNENLIAITSYPENGTNETKELLITYSTEEF